ncbi:MAG: M60 family metallopeptidase [Oscillibacter sp.]|nr:M60 family metallopeptidase [Oscillibacter sp.]
MNNKITRWLGIVVGAVLLLGSGCSKDDIDAMPDNTFEIAEKDLSFNFTQAQEIVFIPVRTGIPEKSWTISSSDESWCKISKSYTNEKGLQLAVLESEEPEVRSAIVKVSAGDQSYDITVRQLGSGPAILVSDRTLSAAGDTVELAVTANIDFQVGRPVIEEGDEKDWIVRLPGETRSFAESSHRFYVQANLMPFGRKATVAVTATEPMYRAVSTTCTFTQETKEVAPSDIPTDKQIKALAATDNQHHGTDDATKLIDGNMETVYHSPWHIDYDNPTTTFPVEFDFEFDGTNALDYFVLYSGNGNGRIGKFDIYYKSLGDADFTLLNEADQPFDFGQRGGQQTARFPRTIEKVTALRISIHDGAGDNGVDGGFVSAQEIEFYQSISSTLDGAILNVFTDLSCSELKPGVSRTEITALYNLSAFIAQQAAVRLMENNYDEFEYEFRAQTYQPYSDNDLNTQLLTKKYSRMDNPTGIEVKTGDQLIVCVDKVPAGQSLSLAVYGEAADGYTANYGSTYADNAYETVDQEVTLFPGMNAITITKPGMCYVMNTARPLKATSEAVKVHILPGCGTVQGYFDLERHKTDDKYVELLNRCSYKYFVAKGRKMIFNFHTAQMRADAPNGISSGLEAWDDIVSWQQELMGIDKCDYFNNHIMAVSSENPQAYMDASHRRVLFSRTTALYKIITREQLLAEEDNTWGPAHELGHVNQGAINWKSTTESSNNLFSNYAIYKMGKYGSRGDALSELALSYANAETWALMGGATHQNEDTELHMRMNWQLWNYYHRCGFKPDFWPKLFQLLREDPLPSEYSSDDNPGASQLKFAEKACEAAGEDLTDFFETWGFFRPIDVNYDQYGSARYRVTDEMIAATKARIAAKNYPKAAPMQYIEDRTTKGNTRYCDMGYYTTFQSKTKITKTPKYTLLGRTYSVSDCDQAVAVELRKASSDELVYFSNLSTFTVPDKADISNVRVYAVQADGERKLINQ